MNHWAARDSDGSLSLFRGERPSEHRVEGYDSGGHVAMAWHSGPGCAFVRLLRRDECPLVRCGECRIVEPE